MTELERKALLGDPEAQRECIEQGIVLPCPFCGGRIEQAITDHVFKCKKCGCIFNFPINVECFATYNFIKKINTRTAPPIGECEDCLYFKPKNSIGTQGICMCKEVEMNCGGELYPLHDDYCKYFKQKENE